MLYYTVHVLQQQSIDHTRQGQDSYWAGQGHLFVYVMMGWNYCRAGDHFSKRVMDRHGVKMWTVNGRYSLCECFLFPTAYYNLWWGWLSSRRLVMKIYSCNYYPLLKKERKETRSPFKQHTHTPTIDKLCASNWHAVPSCRVIYGFIRSHWFCMIRGCFLAEIDWDRGELGCICESVNMSIAM